MTKPQTRELSSKRNMTKRATQYKKKVVPKSILNAGVSAIPETSTSTIHVEQGGKVAVLDINDATGNAIKDDNYIFVHCDVTKDDDVMLLSAVAKANVELHCPLMAYYPKSIETAVNAFGKLDLLVNNAAIQPAVKSIDEMPVAEFEHVLNTNLVGYFRMCKYSLPHLRRTKGSVVNIASITSTLGLKGISHYVASKGGVVSMTRALAVDEASISEVRINSISPGSVDTPLNHAFYDFDEAKLAGLCKTNLMGRLADTREIALTCLYLAVDATFCTGSNLKCSGGIEFGLGTKLL